MANHVRLYINNRPAELIRSIVERNGTRAVDTGVFTLSRKYAITEGDKFQYIQDVVSPKYLVGLWNMEHNTRDESGRDIDAFETTAEIHEGDFQPDGTSDASKAGGYAYRNKSGNNGRCIEIPRTGQTTNFDHLNFDGAFDIIILAGHFDGYPNSYTGYLLGKGSSNNSIEIYTASGANNTDAMVMKADVRIGGTTTTLTGTTDINKRNVTHGSGTMEHFWWIRLKRDESNTITLMLDDNVEATSADKSGDISTNDSLFIAGNKTGSNTLERGNYTAQVRIYSGATLTDVEWRTLISAKRPTEVMKFGGTVWKIDEKITHKVCYCKGLSDKLHNVTVNAGSLTYPTWTTGDADIVKNEYYDKDGRAIIEDLLKVYSMGMNVAAVADMLDQVYDHYGAYGSILDNITILSLAENRTDADCSFHVTPRGTLFLEQDDISHSDIIFRQSSLARFSNLGWDDTNLITQLTIMGTVSTVSQIKKVEGSDFSQSLDSGNGYPSNNRICDGQPTTCKVTNPSGDILVNLHEKTAEAAGNFADRSARLLSNRVSGAAATGEFKVDYHNRKIWLGDQPPNNSTVWTIETTYQDSFNNKNVYWTEKGTNFDSLGAFSKTWHVPHFQNTFPLYSLAGRAMTRFGSLERRVTITVPTLVNHIRENYEVKVVAPDFAVGTEDTSEVNNDTPISLSVKSMKFLYPEGQTIINCGEHMFDSFDMDKAFSEAHGQQKSNIVTSPA